MANSHKTNQSSQLKAITFTERLATLSTKNDLPLSTESQRKGRPDPQGSAKEAHDRKIVEWSN